MNILFVTTKNPRKQGDLLEVSILHGLRTVMGIHCIDWPRKKVMYHDWSNTPKDELHGRGFTLYTKPIEDFSNEDRNKINKFDVILYGDGHMYGEPDDPRLLQFSNNIWHLDGHDLHGDAPKKIMYNGDSVIATQFTKCFKRELVEDNLEDVYPTGFGIPSYQIRPLNFLIKDQMYQKTAPDNAILQPVTDLGGSRTHHKFTEEKNYYNDLQRSWFGLTCKKGGWDCLRHYEIIAAGALLLFKDYDIKHPLCSPQDLPCYSYSTKEELDEIMNRLVINNIPTDEYFEMIIKQREWLINKGTTEARAINIIKVLQEKL